MAHWIPVCGATLGGLAVACGAFGAHALEGRFSASEMEAAEQLRLLSTWEVAVRYQMYHALALLLCAALSQTGPRPQLGSASGCFVIGTAIFSGCLYALVLSGQRFLGAIVPIGGTVLIVGWGLLGWQMLPRRGQSGP